LSAWLGNRIQQQAIEMLYALEWPIHQSQDKDILADWRKLQTSDHFYYMCTKWFNDGDVHAYFSPYASPYEAYINFSNAVHDLKYRIIERGVDL
jgi:alpha-amylase